MPPADREARLERGLKTAGLFAGPALGMLVYLWNPGGHPPEARRLLAVVALTVAWWMSEALPLPATALVGSAVAIATGIAPARQVLAPYADPVIFLFMGSFLLAEAFRKYGLDVRVARSLLSLPVFARSPRGLLAGFGVTSATVSSILSNTATAALLAPVAMGAVDAREGKHEGKPRKFDSAVLLMVAYGASIGGMATLIGTPPNLLAAGFLERLAGVRVGFTGWLLFGVPLSLALLGVALVVTRLVLGRGLGLAPGGAAPDLVDTAKPGAETRAGAAWTIAAILLAFVLWTAPAVAAGLLGRSHPLARALDRHFPEAGVALLCGALLFAAPAHWRERRFVLAWDDAQRINWGVLLLFGGWLSLGTLAGTTGLAKWAGEGVVRSGLATSPQGLLFVSIAAALVVTEFASNTAAATLIIPVVVAAAREAAFDPVLPALGAGLACTCAFVFPVSTPPNAIVFGTGRVPLPRMIRAGILLDLACLVVLWAGLLLLRPLLPQAG
jgi:sodium-dependent dicarboxylate transporter 2/3/5